MGKQWTEMPKKPLRDGWYEVQTPDVADPYHTDAHWDGSGWWLYGKHVTLSVRREVPVTRWRAKAKERG